ncbi:MAG: portal protein [Solimonas sp.]
MTAITSLPAAPESEEMKAQRMAIIQAFSEIILGKRTDAIEARRASGIEQDWQEDEDHYDGIDDANRGSGQTQKGRSPTDGLRETRKDTSTRSTVFLKITRPYVDAAAARVSDMLLPTDDRNFALRPTPRPELTGLIKQAQQAAPQLPAPPQKPGGVFSALGKVFGMAGQPAAPQAPSPLQQAQTLLAQAKAAAERAQEQIDDWLVECRYHAEVRKVIESAAKTGTGILKGPQPTLTRKRAARQLPPEAGGGWAVEMVEQIAPTSKAINPWNFYPDGACGDGIQKGGYVFECDDITRRKLQELKSDPSYLAEMIELCIEEGPTSVADGTRKLKDGDKASEQDLFQIWYFHGQVSKKDMEAAGCRCSSKELYPAMVTMVNDRVIKVTLSPLDSGEFPYDVMTWQSRPNHWAGVGVARQMRECQKGANAAVRNLMDNAGLSAGPQVIVDRNKIVPANGRWEITPRKIWYTVADEQTEDVSKAFIIISIETRQAELMAILQFWLKEAEDVTGLPMLLQGQQGKAPDTLGGMQIMNNNGSTVLRRIARTFDDRITEPHMGRYYEWLLLYGQDEAKGDFTIDARGSSALVERDMQAQQLIQMLGLSLNPAYGLDPELVALEFLKSLRFDPKSVTLTDEKKQQMAQRQPPEDPRVTAARIVAKSKEDALLADVQVRKMEIGQEAKDADADRQLKQWVAQTNAQLEAANLTAEERRHLEDVKATLTGIALKLKTTTDLAMGAHAIDVHKHRNPGPVLTPPIEPAGRAQAGRAYEQ